MEKPAVQEDCKNPPQTEALPQVLMTTGALNKPRKASLVWPFVWLVVALSWTAPIITLLVLNFKRYIAGAGVACGIRKCNASLWYSDDPGSEATKDLNHEDHNINGALQIVAKVLEIWFLFVAGGLVFDCTMWLARKKEGLPLRYLEISEGFTELLSFLSPAIWMTPISMVRNSSTPHRPNKHNVMMLYTYITFAFIICLACNLMGPATAVLLLPTLGWRTISAHENQAIATIGVSSAPVTTDILPNCTAPDLINGSYSCVTPTIGSVMDAALDVNMNGKVVNPQGKLAFILNTTTFPSVQVTPSRQTIQDLEYDFLEWVFSGAVNYSLTAQLSPSAILTPSLYNGMRNSQHVIRQRQGPGYRSSCDCSFRSDLPSVIQLPGDKVVRCFDIDGFYSLLYVGFSEIVVPNSTTRGGLPVSTICIRSGTGWGGSNVNSQFYLGNSSASTPIKVQVYSSDNAVFLNSSTYACSTTELAMDTGACDWEALFAAEPEPLLKNISVNALVTEYIYSDNSTSSWCVSFTFLRFPTYAIDTSFSGNPLWLVTLTDNAPFTDIDEPIFVHPDWILMGWGVDKNGIIPYENQSVQYFEQYMQEYVDEYMEQWQGGGRTTFSGGVYSFVYGHQTIMAQGLSWVPYSLVQASAPGITISPQMPVLNATTLVYVWSYGLDSRTSQLGVAVVIAGCVIALIRIFVGLATRTVSRETLSFITTALQQEPPATIRNLDEEEIEGKRFRMENRKNAEFEFLS